ncbi:hypothetical protein Kpol_1066p13 [Vanderwaltozyma polyspora DSM 70294]|uniref:Uncharacterized protein n=1 Tax=Vanderwaltozyma polyspora (strain ATCC 22028 / DSM 70294 / BCRC 21397 / CBS 2163 / NBRC 10782 / NRRL Y-8283 / UCD 57-17) TaxID=436907 RepID=A7TMN5_VANPO|nr:uncharacterized protein Kpol_1066p13 [Vanderwaltozyma polyspora DSM 70294]EDO16449.1 hypothetical protein Kpol_1066p13 [Vanderwaltozyma polyspora DSM 70294]
MGLPKSRLASLYKDFTPLKELNPDGYVANINTWVKYLHENYLSDTRNVVLHIGTQFLQCLSDASHGTPSSIDLVIDKLVEDGVLIPYNEFTSGSIGLGVSTSMFSWLTNRFGMSSRFTSRKSNNEMGYLKDMDLIIKENLINNYSLIIDEINSNILVHVTGISDLVFSREQFIQRAGVSKYLNLDSYDAMLLYLKDYKKVIAYSDNVVKIINCPFIKSSASFPQDITDNDVAIVNIKTNISNISQRIKQMEDKIRYYNQKLTVKATKREVLKEYLRAKMIIEKHLLTLLKFQNNLIEVKHQIDLSATNATLVETLSRSVDVMRSLNEYAGSTEGVEQLLDAIENEKLKSNKIGDLLSSIGYNEEDEDVEELDKELEKLTLESDIAENVDKEKENKDKQLDKLRDLISVSSELKKHENTNTEKSSDNAMLIEE